MYSSKTFFFVAVAGVASTVSAATPPNFQPASNGELIIAFGNILATQGVDIPKDLTTSMPTIGTSTQMAGTYSIVLADPDIPGGGQFLHWMQTGLVSSNVQTTVAGRQIFALTNPNNATAAIAAYRGPAPPAQAPLSHRYISMLVNTTNNQAALTALMTSGASRNPFNAQTAIQSTGLTVLAGGWFNVTNGSGSGATTPSPTSALGRGATPLPTTRGAALPTAGRASPTASGGLGRTTGIPFKGDAGLLMAPGVALTGLGALFVLFF